MDSKLRSKMLNLEGITNNRKLKKVKTGFDRLASYEKQKNLILDHLKATQEDWDDWRWHLRQGITNTTALAKLLNLNDTQQSNIEAVEKEYHWKVSPYYLALMNPNSVKCPVRMQAIPDIRELDDCEGIKDPVNETGYTPIPGIVRRYPDRLILKVTHLCCAYCRHCQRRRDIKKEIEPFSLKRIETAIEYIKGHKEIRDVLITGGDPLTLDDKVLDWLLEEISKIPHVEIKRIGTRMPVTLPQRITPELCNILAKYQPLYINTQFNHPFEITPESARACLALARSGVVLGNQTVLLKGINNNANTIKKLNHELLKICVRPYYLFYKQPTAGTKHFATLIEEGISIMEQLRGHTSGLAIPTFVVNAPGGMGKIPLLPNYWLTSGKGYVVLRSWDNQPITIQNP